MREAALVAERRAFRLRSIAVLAAFVVACSIYANLALTIGNPANYRFFPPFEPYCNANENRNAVTVTEYAHLGWSVYQGQGFANLFGQQTGPTAWMPPALPTILAGLFWVCNGDRDATMVVTIVFQVLVLIGTGIVVLAVIRNTTRCASAGVAVAVFLVGLLYDFRLCFQRTDDCWLVLLAVDLLIAGSVWLHPFASWQKAAAWGVVGGTSALINPIAGFCWAILTLWNGWCRRAWRRLFVALGVTILALVPWTIRNYAIFQRWIPVKSNLAYELYQSQCLQPDGLIQRSSFAHHPGRANQEAREYAALGEKAYLDRKRALFRQAVWVDPWDFAVRVAWRFLAATVWYVPFDRNHEVQRPWTTLLSRWIHPFPFLALLVLLATSSWRRLQGIEWAVICIYVLYLLPYIVISYYERYAVPLLGAKVLLVVWAIDRLLSSRFYVVCASHGR
jgi:hypothetical protein